VSVPDPTARLRFARLVREAEPDLAEALVLMAADIAPEVPAAGRWPDHLDKLAERVRAELPEDPGPAAARDALALVLGARAGFSGEGADYADLRSSLLPEVLRRRRGLPILLSVVWSEVGRRAGLPVYGVALPGHFVVGIGDPDGDFVLADPFRGGEALSPEAARALAARAGGAPDDPDLLRPAAGHGVLLRVLNNIRMWARRPEVGPAGAWTRLRAVELSLLLPRHPADLRREHGLLLVRTGEFLRGAKELDTYADLVAGFDPALAETVRRESAAARARLN
jgi:regulator of sirC expression with transglutaminase-like and TPR domain